MGKSPPWDINDQLILQSKCVNDVGDVADPTTLYLEIFCPDGTTVTADIDDMVRVSLGIYEFVYVVANGIGDYEAVWTGTGSVPIVKRRTFPVRTPAGES